MAFTIRFVFSGVFAFVPDDPFYKTRRDGTLEPGSPTRVWAIAPKLDLPELADWDREAGVSLADMPHFRKAHHPALMVESRHVLSEYLVPLRPFHKRVGDLGSSDDRLFGLLSQNLFSLEDGGDGPRGGLHCANTVLPASQQVPNASSAPEMESLWWLPRLSEIAPDYSRIPRANDPDDDCFSFQRSSISVAIPMDRGRLTVSGFNLDRFGELRSWEFSTAERAPSGEIFPEPERSRMWKRAIGNRITWEVAIGGEWANLVMSSTTGEPQEIRLGPSPRLASCSCEPVVTVWLANEEPEHYLRDENGAPVFTSGPEMFFDPDFQAFYRLAGDTRGTRRYPYSSGSLIGLQGRPCSPGGANGFS